MVILQGHQHRDDALVITHIVPVYNGRIFLPCGVYSQRMQSAQDVIAPVPSAQYATSTARHVARCAVGEDEMSLSVVVSVGVEKKYSAVRILGCTMGCA